MAGEALVSRSDSAFMVPDGAGIAGIDPGMATIPIMATRIMVMLLSMVATRTMDTIPIRQ